MDFSVFWVGKAFKFRDIIQLCSQDEEFSESSEESGTPNPRPSLHTTDSNRENETYVSNNVINVESRQNASNASSEYLFNVSNVQQSSYNVPSGHQLQPSQNQILNSGWFS